MVMTWPKIAAVAKERAGKPSAACLDYEAHTSNETGRRSEAQPNREILQAEAAAGMYKKPVEVLAREIHYGPLPGKVRAVVIAAWQRGGLLPKEAVEKFVPSRAV